MRHVKIVILAGFGQASRKILNINKSFLKIEDIPLFIYVVQALTAIESLDKIVIVGPTDKVKLYLKKYFSSHPYFDKLLAVNQGTTLYESVTNGIKAFFPLFPENSGNGDDSILFLPGDIPLLNKDEVVEFLRKSAHKNSDYCVGVVSEKSIEKLISERYLKGVELFCFPFKEGHYRINNLHILKPFKLYKGFMINKMYQLRFLASITIKSPVTWELLKSGYGKSALYFVIMQCAVVFKKSGLSSISNLLRIFLPMCKIETIVGDILSMKISAVEVYGATSAIDVDSEKDYRAILKTFDLPSSGIKSKVTVWNM